MLTHMIQFLGICLIVLALVDVFLTVLYARIGAGVSSMTVSRGMWRIFKWIARRVPRYREQILTFFAPITLVVIAAIWVQAIMIGTALIVWPALGTSVRAAQGPTPDDFLTAYYYSGDVLTTVGKGDLVAHTRFFKLLNVFEAIIGMSLFTLTVTYLLEVYTALQRRNAFAVSLHHETSATGDAAEKVMAMGPSGDFEGARSDLQTIASRLVDLYETHHFFWILTYFRFKEPHYALSRVLLVSMEMVTIIRSALDEQRYRAIIHCGPVTEIWNVGMHLLTHFADVFLPRPPAQAPEELGAEQEELWRLRYREIVMKLKGAGIETAQDAAAGEQQYVSMRREWDRYTRAFDRYLAYDPDDIDPALAHVRRAADRSKSDVGSASAAGFISKPHDDRSLTAAAKAAPTVGASLSRSAARP